MSFGTRSGFSRCYFSGDASLHIDTCNDNVQGDMDLEIYEQMKGAMGLGFDLTVQHVRLWGY